MSIRHLRWSNRVKVGWPKWWHRPSLCRFAGKSKRVAGAPLIFVDFRGLKPPHTMANQGGSWVGFVKGNESFKMVVVASKNSTGVGRNRPWKMGGHELEKPTGKLGFFFFFFFFLFLIGSHPLPLI
ncbi:S2-RNase [Pyrus ussuriensis x Pyrus communis]|uniref:S2-RNase n=1 Tax=Pyrus ussuriensis x Pyrus communis TaxID=2448454 RepID=A0A5N5F2H2_9ROSA|nr:S2-RNase [Pyrus ussuriensis x Pyrus communis]